MVTLSNILPEDALSTTSVFSQPANSLFFFRSIARPVGPSVGESDQRDNILRWVISREMISFLSSILINIFPFHPLRPLGLATHRNSCNQFSGYRIYEADIITAAITGNDQF
jgi:hypothetical protein